MPESAETLQEVSGIGDYTAAAIASIAFGEPAAAVDGNVCRVVARLFAIEENILTNRGRSAVKHFAEQLLPHDRPGDFNQAWMDLGSSICTPKTPRCLLCPLKEHCRSFAEGRVAEFPVRESKTIVKDEALLVLLLICNGEYLVRRRPRGGLWSGLWEFPNVVTTPAASTKPVNRKPKGGQAAQRRAAQALPGDEAAALLTSMGMQADDAGRPEDFECLGEVTHQLSHRNLSFSVWRGELSAGFEPEDTAYRWVSPAAFAKLSVSTAHRKIWKLVDNL
ncbi:MAG: A/G-specific adenine glycosylase, partial [Phycisphaerae bacterium]